MRWGPRRRLPPRRKRSGRPSGLAAAAVRIEEVVRRGRSELERAVDLAYKAAGRRERTIAELRTCLERKRVEPAAIDAAVAELCDAGLLDDARYARRFTEDKRELERW